MATANNETGSAGDSNPNIVCYVPYMLSMNGLWRNEIPVDFSLSLFLIQVAIVVITTRILQLAIRPFRQPRVLAEILVRILPNENLFFQPSMHARGYY